MEESWLDKTQKSSTRLFDRELFAQRLDELYDEPVGKEKTPYRELRKVDRNALLNRPDWIRVGYPYGAYFPLEEHQRDLFALHLALDLTAQKMHGFGLGDEWWKKYNAAIIEAIVSARGKKAEISA